MKSKLILALLALAIAMSFAFTMIEKNDKQKDIAVVQQPQSGFALEDTNQF